MTFVLRANDATRDQVLANCKRFLDMLPAEKSWRVEIAPFAKSRNHIDGVKHHCHYSNLEWCTRQENMVHAWETGLCKPRKLTSQDVQKILSGKLNDGCRVHTDAAGTGAPVRAAR